MEAYLKKSLHSGRQFTMRGSEIDADTRYAKGEVILFNNMLGFFLEKCGGANQITTAKANGEILPDVGTVMVEHECVMIAKATGITFAVGERVQWDVADNNVNKSTTGNYACGTVTRAAASGDTEVEIMFDGRNVVAGS